MLEKLSFKEATFLASHISKEQFPSPIHPSGSPLPEIAIVGRSNVGKSSLINHLLNTKKLAKVSATPGKTQMLNFFLIDKELILVDLPGYGYAAVSKSKQINWAEAIDMYLHQRRQLKTVLFLLDIRRTPNADDLAFFDWIKHSHIRLIIVFTKTDKLKQRELAPQVNKNLSALGIEKGDIAFPYVLYSIKNARGKNLLINTIKKVIDELNS